MNPDQRIKQLAADKKDLIRRLEQERQDHHEAAALKADQLMKLRIGDRQ